MAFLYDYMTESELELAKEEKEFEMESTRIMNAMIAIEMKHGLDIKQIESQAMFESYTDDQLTEEYEKEYLLYMEATDSVWAKFKAFVKGILDKILGRKSGDVPSDMSDTEVTLDDNPSKVREILDKVAGVFKNTNGDLDLLKVTIAGIGTVTGVKLLKDKLTERKAEKTKIKAGQLSSEISKTEKSVKNLNDSIPADPKDNSFKSTLIGIGNFVVGLGQKIINSMKNIITKITGHQFKSQEGENAGANGETNDNANTPDSSKEGEKPAENGEGDNANQQNNSNQNNSDNSKGNSKIHADKYVGPAGGDYEFGFDLTKATDDDIKKSGDKIKEVITDIIDYGKDKDVLKELNTKWCLGVVNGKVKPIKAGDITEANLGTDGLHEIITIANRFGAQNTQQWKSVVDMVGKHGNASGIASQGKLKSRSNSAESAKNEKDLESAAKKENVTFADIAKDVFKIDQNAKGVYTKFSVDIRNQIKTITGSSRMPRTGEKYYNDVISYIDKNGTPADKKLVFELYQQSYSDDYKDNKANIDKAMNDNGVDHTQTKGHTEDKHRDDIENEMVKFANDNQVKLFGTSKEMKTKGHYAPGKKGKPFKYNFTPSDLTIDERNAYFRQAASNIIRNSKTNPYADLWKTKGDELAKFATYFKNLYKITRDSDGKFEFNRKEVDMGNDLNDSLKAIFSSSDYDLDTTGSHVYESLDFDEFENILVTESEIDMMFESTTSEIVSEINDILESTFMTTK